LEKTLREVLANIALNPKYYPEPLDIVAGEVVREIRKRFVKVALSHKDSESLAVVLDNVLSPDYRRGIVSAYYYLVGELGLDKSKALEMIVKAIEVVVGLRKTSDLPPVHRTIINYVIEIIESEGTYSPYPLSLLDYATELSLVYWDGEKWSITELGKFLLKLPPFEFIKALLTIEILLPKTSFNCMSSEFLQLLRKLFSRSDEHRIEYIVSISKTPRPLVYSWLSRLANLGLLSIDYREQKVKANQHTFQFLEKVLDISSNLYFSLLYSLISHQDPPMITTNIPSCISKMRNDPLISSYWNEIRQAIDSLDRGNYHAALRTVLPVIERILREIAIEEGLAGTDKGLNALVDIVKGHKFISVRTEGLIKALGRDVEFHGLEQLDTDRAKFYAELALMTLLELVRDYRRHKLLHQALQEIAPQLNMDPKELLKAYPNNRKTIHVHFLSDTRLRITIKSKHVYEINQKTTGELEIYKIA